MDNKIVYIRMRHRIQIKQRDKVLLKDVAQLIADEHTHNVLSNLLLYEVTDEDRNIVIIDVTRVIREIRNSDREIEVQTIGPAQTILEVIYRKKRVTLPLFILIWLLLFFGSALAIMNFHEDVSMRIVHQQIYTIITGKVEEKPLLLQIPYSIGLGLGMILFFNHVFKKRLNEEPSPLEVEIFKYQQDLNQYVIMHENKENRKQDDDA